MVHRNNKDKYNYFRKSLTGISRTNYSHSGEYRNYLSKAKYCGSYSGKVRSYWSTVKYFVKSKVLN